MTILTIDEKKNVNTLLLRIRLSLSS